MNTEHLLDPEEVAYRNCACENCSEIAIGPADSTTANRRGAF